MDNKDKDTDYLNIYSNDIKLNKKNKERYDILDNIKGLLIFTVVFSHFLFNYSSKNSNSLSHKFVNFIYCFHMPSFIFWSGFFSKSENSRNFKSITKLILIYAIFNYSHAFILYKYKKFNFNIFYPYNSYWYLLCLIYWRFSIQYFANQYFSITVSFIISILVGFWKEIDSVFSIKRAFSFYPYFLVGFKFPQQYLEKIIKIRKKIYFISPLLFLLLLYISLKYLIFIEVNHSMMNNDYKNIKEDIKIRIKLFISSYFIILLGILIIPNRNIYFLTKIGKNSLYSYLFHRIFTIIIDKELFSQNKHEFYIINYSIFFFFFFFLIFGFYFFVLILNKYINYFNYNLLKINII